MFPHDKLDWTMSRLDKRLDAAPDDVGARSEYAAASLSKAWFHDGGELWFNQALTQARRILQQDPSNPAALVVAGAALVGLGRLEPASRYLDEATRVAADRGDVHLALAEMHRHNRDIHQGVREAEIACRTAPKSWEAHALLGQLLWQRAQELGGRGRLVERSQFHTVRALQLGAAGPRLAPMDYHLGITCLHMGRYADAHKLFSKLLDQEGLRDKAQYYLGLVSYQMGKYKNAVMYLRRHLQRTPNNPRVLSRLGMCYLQLGEIAKAREVCNKALAVDPTDLQARWTLGCALVEEQREEEATRVFKEILADAPDHAPAFDELVRIRCAHRDVNWLRKALHTEVARYDRLPVSVGGNHGPAINPQKTTRARIGSILRALSATDPKALSAMINAMDLTNDEGLRFQLWEGSLDCAASRKARAATAALQTPGKAFASTAGREILSLADRIPEQLLTQGLDLSEEDLRRAAVDRHGPSADVRLHRTRIDDERREARAWQALLLLALGAKQNPSSRNLLVRWANEADPDLAEAARAGLVMLGDTEAADHLRKHARARGAANLVDAMLTHIDPPRSRFHPRMLDASTDVTPCATCGRRATEAGHILGGGEGAVCDHCMAELARDRRNLLLDDPESRCSLCDKNNLEARHVFGFRGVNVCNECLELSLGQAEREEIERYLATW